MNSEIQFALYSLVLAALGAFSVLILKRHPDQRKDMSSPKMSNPNETLMLTFGMGVVMAWVIIAAAASYYSVVEQRDISDLNDAPGPVTGLRGDQYLYQRGQGVFVGFGLSWAAPETGGLATSSNKSPESAKAADI